jgi:ElaB/YqjD/DUF883 family membrane-anchored ribosome-binding protein
MSHHDHTDDPAVIEREIAHTRASLQRKLDELQHRLSPRERLRAETHRVKAAVRNVDPAPYTGAAALAAVGLGAAMAVRGLRRRNHQHQDDAITPCAADLAGE